MQKYWPAYKAVAKLRHKATISEMKGVQLHVQTISERLDEMERSSASFAPIWIQQGKTGIWIGPTESVRPSLDGPIPVPTPVPVPTPIPVPASIPKRVNSQIPSLDKPSPVYPTPREIPRGPQLSTTAEPAQPSTITSTITSTIATALCQCCNSERLSYKKA